MSIPSAQDKRTSQPTVEACLSGSQAEFYITLAISCCGDVYNIFYVLEDRCQSRNDFEVHTFTGEFAILF